MSDPTPEPPPPPTAISRGDHELLARAAELHRPLARAARIGRGNAAAYAIFGVLSMMLALVGPDAVGLVLGAVLLGVGLFERRECARLVHADVASPRRLARAELILLGTIVLYGVLGLTVLPSAGEALKRGLPGANGAGIDVVALAESLNRIWYGTVICVTLLYQGGMARYFHGRNEALARYRETVPSWAREVVESMAG